MNARSAIADGMSRICTSRVSRNCRMRSKSATSSRGRITQSAKSDSACRANLASDRHGEHRRIGRDLGFEVGADAGKRGVHVDRRQVARAFVHHVARSWPRALRTPRNRRPSRLGSTSMNVTTGSVRCSADQSDRRLGRRSFLMREKRNGSDGPTAGRRERSARVTTPPPASNPAARATACLSARRSPPRDCRCGDTFGPHDADPAA